MASKDRKRFATMVGRAMWALSWRHGEFSRAPARSSPSLARGHHISLLHRQPSAVSAFLIIAARFALGQTEATQSLIKGRSLYVMASSPTVVVPVDGSSVAPVEHMESAPYLDESTLR